MAHYEVTHTCGHTVRVNLVGPHSSREWRMERMRQELCRDCWQAQELATAQAAAAAAGLPAWTAGTPAQRDWAERLRVTLLDRLESAYRQQVAQAAVALGEAFGGLMKQAKQMATEQPTRVAALYAAGRAALIEERTDAKWWIDHRDDADLTLLRLTLAQGIAVRPDLAPPELRPAVDASTAQPAAQPAAPAIPAYILRPETPLSQTIATVVYEPATDRLVMRFPEYHEQIRAVMHDLDFTWMEHSWVRRLSALSASERKPQHRLAEVATRLVTAGFVVRLRDADAYALAQAGTFEPEQRRWVRIITDATSAYHGWLALIWPRSDDLYAAANQLRGARFREGRMLVPPGSADEVEEFARVYEFAISLKAQAALDGIHASVAHGVVLSPPKPKRRARRSGDGTVPISATPPPLPVPEVVEVADALRDDD